MLWSFRWRVVTLVVAAVICFGASVQAHPPLPATCNPAIPSTCTYTSDLNFPNPGVFRTTLTDPLRNNYQLPILVRYPVGAVGPRPVIIFNHGGGPSASGREGSPEWSIAMAMAGYVVIHPSRSPALNPTPYLTECDDNGRPTTPVECAGFIAQFILGPSNTEFLISQFANLQALHPAMGTLDSSKVVVAGWSGGSTIVLANAGAWRQFTPGGPIYNQRTALPIAFFGVAPMGPDYAGFEGGFQSRSYDSIDGRNFLSITGKGDTNGKPSEARTTAWLRARPGRKYLSYDNKIEANHATMNIGAASGCATALQATHCDWIESMGIAYLDAVVRRRPLAIQWLASDAYEVLTSGEIEMQRR